jgi:hypothetical protein
MSLTVSLGQVGFGVGGAIAGMTYTMAGYTSNTIFAAFFVLAAGIIIYRYIPEPQLMANSLTSKKNTLLGLRRKPLVKESTSQNATKGELTEIG